MDTLFLSKQEIIPAASPKEIADCFAVMQELRPHFKDKDLFVEQVMRQRSEGYFLVYLKEGEDAAACMGFRIFEMLAWGKIMYIDDLVTRERSRKKGFAKMLLDYAVKKARLENCKEVHLDSGHHRYDAHRLYLNYGFKINCHHFAYALGKPS